MSIAVNKYGGPLIDPLCNSDVHSNPSALVNTYAKREDETDVEHELRLNEMATKPTYSAKPNMLGIISL